MWLWMALYWAYLVLTEILIRTALPRTFSNGFPRKRSISGQVFKWCRLIACSSFSGRGKTRLYRRKWRKRYYSYRTFWLICWRSVWYVNIRSLPRLNYWTRKPINSITSSWRPWVYLLLWCVRWWCRGRWSGGWASRSPVRQESGKSR